MGLTEPEPSRSKDYILGHAAGFRAGAEQMREAAAKACIERSVRVGHRALPISTGQACADAIRVLPLPEMPK